MNAPYEVPALKRIHDILDVLSRARAPVEPAPLAPAPRR